MQKWWAVLGSNSSPGRVKRGYGAYVSTICELGSQLQQALVIT